MSKSISFLLGAGFSAPMGYPIGDELNNSLLKCDGDSFAFHTSGHLCISKDGKKPNFGYKTSYDFEFDFCRDLIHHFNDTRGYFDYEEFYDYFNFDAKNDDKVKKLFKANNYGTKEELEQMLFAIKNIYNQLVSYFLVDKDGKKWYDDEGHMCGPWWPGYTGILNCFQNLGEEHIIDVHTLNHDLFFERLNISDWFQGNICDGFEELGSPYFGKLDVNGRYYNVRLERYTGRYEKNYRLYKLHGSRDYGLYYTSKGTYATPEKYIKTRYGVGFGEFYKEQKNEKGDLEYENCWLNYHADFLTGTTSKINRYKEPLLFNKLFDRFKDNLKKAEKLIIIGYGGKDEEINKILLEHFDFKNKSAFIIDPYTSKKVKALQKELNAELIEKFLEDVKIEDLE